MPRSTSPRRRCGQQREHDDPTCPPQVPPALPLLPHRYIPPPGVQEARRLTQCDVLLPADLWERGRVRGRHAGEGPTNNRTTQDSVGWPGKGTDASSPQTGRSAPTSVPPHVVGIHTHTAPAYRQGGKQVQAVQHTGT